MIAAFAVSAAVSLLLTPLVARLAARCGAVDHPDERRAHKTPTPTWGGLAIFVGFWTGLLIFGWPVSRSIMVLLGASAVLLVVSAADDRRGLSPLLRLSVHVLLAGVLWWLGEIRIYGVTLPLAGYLALGRASLPVTLVWIVVIVNALNWLDGMDGLAGGVAAISATTLAVLAWGMGWTGVSLMGAVLAGAAVGFLRHNVRPARIFMGDAGATFLGLMLGCMAVIGPLKVATTVTVLIPVLILGVPIYDVLSTIARRLLGRQPVHIGDRQHVHHRLLGRGWSEDVVVMALWIATGMLGVMALLLHWLLD